MHNENLFEDLRSFAYSAKVHSYMPPILSIHTDSFQVFSVYVKFHSAYSVEVSNESDYSKRN
jgi:hypothetical protein